MATRVNHQEIVKAALDAKVVDFAAIGRLVAQLGPGLAFAEDPWDSFCGTMRTFIRLYILQPGLGATVADLGRLQEIAANVRSNVG